MMSMIHLMLKSSDDRGFALLMASLVASLLATIGLTLYVLSEKNIRLSATGRESQKAFYAADAGADCALFFNFYYDAFATSTTFTDKDKMKCVGQTLYEPDTNTEKEHLGGWDEDTQMGTTDFRFDLPVTEANGAPAKYCVIVRVEKFVNDDGFNSTVIDSRGYNTDCQNKSSGLRVVERSVRLSM